MNLVDMQEGVQTMIDDFKSGNIGLNTLLSNFEEVATEVGGERSRNTAAGAVIGGIAGAPLGPAGIYAGIVADSSISFFMIPKNDRAVVGFLVEDPPEDDKIVLSNHSAISDVTPIQLVVESTVENEDDDWIRETNTRSWNMDAVEDALTSIPEYEADEAPPGGYYIQDIETGISWSWSLARRSRISQRANSSTYRRQVQATRAPVTGPHHQALQPGPEPAATRQSRMLSQVSSVQDLLWSLTIHITWKSSPRYLKGIEWKSRSKHTTKE